MFGSVILDVAVGLILVYLLFSLVSASIREWLAGLLKTRATTLEKGLLELFGGDERLVGDLYDQPLINSLYRGGTYADAKRKRALPSYIPARSFSAALLDMIVRGRDTASGLQSGSEARVITAESVRAQVMRLGNARVQRAVLSALDTANGDLAAVQADSVALSRAVDKLSTLNLPLVGWQQVNVPGSLSMRGRAGVYGTHALHALIGWLITAFAISLGAPFWFDTLGRIMVVRNTVKPNQKSPNEASDDRQDKTRSTSPVVSAPGPVTVTTVVPRMTVPVVDFQPQEWALGHPDAGVL